MNDFKSKINVLSFEQDMNITAQGIQRINAVSNINSNRDPMIRIKFDNRHAALNFVNNAKFMKDNSQSYKYKIGIQHAFANMEIRRRERIKTDAIRENYKQRIQEDNTLYLERNEAEHFFQSCSPNKSPHKYDNLYNNYLAHAKLTSIKSSLT